MKIWILQTGEPLPIDPGSPRPMRAMSLSSKLIDSGHEVTLWSSLFDHQKKKNRHEKFSFYSYSNKLIIRLIPSLGYKKHIGIRRLFDHAQMAYNLKNILKLELVLPDIVFIGYPPIETAFVLAEWARKKNIPVILDIKDMWPSLFVEAFPKPFQSLAKLIFQPYFYMSKKIIRNADSITTMAPGFLNWIATYANRKNNNNDKIFRLTSPIGFLSREDAKKAQKKWINLGLKKDIPTFYFAGTFMSVFDFDPIKVAAVQLAQKNIPCQFILCGDGAYLDEVKKQMIGLPNVLFPGWMDRLMIESLARMSVASIAPYKNIDNFINNTPNKIVDSLILGKPLLCPLHGEVAKLIKDHTVGFTYNNHNLLSDYIHSLISNKKLQNLMSNNAKKLYETHFEFNTVYDGLVDHLEKMVLKHER